MVKAYHTLFVIGGIFSTASVREGHEAYSFDGVDLLRFVSERGPEFPASFSDGHGSYGLNS